MNIREYEITIRPGGEVEVHISGFKGKGCLDAVKLFEQLIGEVGAIRPTDSYFEPDEDVRLRTGQHH
ncbi:MAG: DUF2997 domain-containing protein [Verrucomicrobiae bacterium]|nr:DUF2997 domain-containing protein [Verrucomicrobiae bacterium]